MIGRDDSQTKDEPETTASGITLADVAALAGVGESTVSRVLRNHGSFSKATRDKVMSAVQQLGYVPNRIAGTLASTGSRLVAIIVPSLSNIVFADVLSGASAGLESDGYQAVFGVTDYDPNREEALIASMLAWRPSAIMVAGLEHTDNAGKMLRASRVRIAELLDIDGPGIDIVVGFSNLEAGRVSARHLLSRGYRRIGYVGHDLERDKRARKRLGGFCEALTEAGMALADQEMTSAPSSVEIGRMGLAKLLERSPALDAVYFSNDDMAIGGYFHCLSHGIGIPTELAIFGYNGLNIGTMAPRPLSTIRTPRVAIGRTAAALVTSDTPSQVVDLGFELIAGATA
ncbi:MAG: LacI family DNA-binding transcriptional regulator [Dongiaceae bacterium]